MKLTKEKSYISPNSKIYKELKTVYLDVWRDRIFERDANKCLICGAEKQLNLAHVTSTLAFVRAFSDKYGLETAIKLSFRNDNLVTLCSTCHKVQHRKISSIYDPVISEKSIELSKIIENNRPVEDYLNMKKEINKLYEMAKKDADERNKKIGYLFEKIKSNRIWGSASQLEVENDDTTTGEKLVLKKWVLAEKIGCRIPTGSHEIPSREGRECGYKASTCAKGIIKCQNCGYFFCEYHFPTHKLEPRNDRW